MDLFGTRFAVFDRGQEALIDFARQEIAQRALVAIGISHHDHLIGELGAIDEGTRVELRLGVADGAQAFVQVGAWFGEGIDAGVVVFRLGGVLAARQGNDVFLAVAVFLFAAARASGGIGIEGRPLIARAPAKHVAELVKDHDSRDEKENRSEIEELHVVRQFSGHFAPQRAIGRPRLGFRV